MTFNPLLWLHLRLMGTWRSQVTIVVVVVALVAIGSGLSYKSATPGNAGAVSATWLSILTAGQAAFLLLLAPSAIRKAVLRDFQTGMIESHRLSPMSGAKIVLGYMTGAPAQALMLYGVALLLGTFFAAHYALSLGVPQAVAGWYLLQICLLSLAFFIASLTLLTSLGSAGKTNILGIIIVIGLFAGWGLVSIIPGLALLSGIMSGQVLFGMITKAAAAGDPTTLIVAAFLQVVFGAVFIAASCGKVRAAERAIFTVPLALLLCLLWGATLVAGMWLEPASRWFGPHGDQIGPDVSIIASTVAFMIVGQFALSAAAVELFHADRTAAFQRRVWSGPQRRALVVPALLAVLAMTVAIAMFRHVADGAPQMSEGLTRGFTETDLRLGMLSAMVLSFLTDFAWMYAAVSGGKGTLRVAIFSAIALKFVPLLGDLAVLITADALDRHMRFSELYTSGVSPIGTLILATQAQGRPWPGLIAQVIIAALSVSWFWRRRRRVLVAPESRATIVARPVG